MSQAASSESSQSSQAIIDTPTDTSTNTTGTDPGIKGAFKVKSEEYFFGNEVFTVRNIDKKAEAQGIVFYPDLSTLKQEQTLPVVLMMHGKFDTCYRNDDGDVALEFGWPCRRGFKSAPYFLGFNYLAEHLASQGFFVVSVSANAINANDDQTFDDGARSRSDLIDAHLSMWRNYNNKGEGRLAGNVAAGLVGKLDFNRLGLLGHSRGGDAVVQFLRFNNAKSTGKFNVKAVMPVAPKYTTPFPATLASLGVVLPYCDGDVKGAEGAQVFDNAMYPVSGEGSKFNNFMFLMMGANHNFFNTVMSPGGHEGSSPFEDWNYSQDPHCGLATKTHKRFSQTKQRAALKAYAGAYFNAMLMGDAEFQKNLPILTGHSAPPASSTLTRDEIHESFHLAAKHRIDIDPVETLDSVTMNSLGGSTRASSDLRLTVCGHTEEIDDACIDVLDSLDDRRRQTPHAAHLSNFDLPPAAAVGTAQLSLTWNKRRAFYETSFPSQDVSGFDFLTFRAGVHFLKHPRDKNVASMRLTLTDANDQSVTVNIDNPNALYFPPGKETFTMMEDLDEFGEGSNDVVPAILPKSILNTVTVQLSKFEGKAINLKAIKSLQLLFNDGDKGSILVSDIAFVKLPSKP